MAGAPLSRRVWIEKNNDAVYLGKWKDPLGAEALFFLDPATRQAIGPLNLQRAKVDPGRSIAAPSVGKAPLIEPGARGQVAFYAVGWEGPKEGQPACQPTDVRGTFAAFTPAPAPAMPLTLGKILESAQDPLVRALILGEAADPEAAKARAELDALTDDVEIGRALEGFRISGNSADALRYLELKGRKNGKWPDGFEFAMERYQIPLEFQGLEGLARAEPCEPCDDQYCHWLAALVAPAKSWLEGRRDSVPREIEEALLRHRRPELGRFGAGRDIEGCIEPLDGPFLFMDDFAGQLLHSVAPDFFECVKSITRNRYSIPSCLFQSASRKDGILHVIVKLDDSGPEQEFLWDEKEPPAMSPGTKIGILIQAGKPGAVIRHRLCGPA